MGVRLREYQQSGGRGSGSNESTHFRLDGWKEFEEAVKKIPNEFKRDIVLRVLRRSTRHAIVAIRGQLGQHDDDGDLWGSVGNITGKSQTFPNVLVGYRVKGSYKGFHGHLLEHGTKHRFRRRKGTKARQVFGKRGRKAISTGSGRAFNIVRKAAAASQAQSVALVEAEMVKVTEKLLKKLFK